MAKYFELNRKSLVQLLFAEAIFFALLLLLGGGPYTWEKVIISFLFSFGMFSLLFTIAFIDRYYKFKKKSALFNERVFHKLLDLGYKETISQPKMIFFLADNFLFGITNGFPVRIEITNNVTHIFFGTQEIKNISSDISRNLEREHMIITELGITRKLKLKEILNHPDENYLRKIIESSIGVIEKHKFEPINVK